MLTPDTLYPLLERLLQAGLLISHATARAQVAQLLATLLVAQDLRPSALIRTLPAPCARAARQRYARVRRAARRPRLTSGVLTPFLIRAALSWMTCRGHRPDGGEPWILALDSVRCGRWEIFTIGLGQPGRALPLAWSVLPYPWPRGQFRPVVDALVARVLHCWPPGTPMCLLADRAFPAKSFFRALRQGGADFAVRLQARHAVTLAGGTCCRVGLLLDAADPTKVTCEPATFGAGADGYPGTWSSPGAPWSASRRTSGGRPVGRPWPGVERGGGSSRTTSAPAPTRGRGAMNGSSCSRRGPTSWRRCGCTGSAGRSKGPIAISRAAGTGSTGGTATR